MKGAIPIATLLCGFAFGWFIHGVSRRTESGHQAKSTPLSPTAQWTIEEPESAPEFNVSQSSALTLNQPKEEVVKVTQGILRDPNLRRRMRNFLVLLDGLTPENAVVVREALAAVADREGSSVSQYQYYFFQRWGEVAKRDAVSATMAALPGELQIQQNLRAAFSGWASADMDGVLSFVQGLPDGSMERKAGSTALLNILVKADLDRAAEFLFTQPDASRSAENLQTLFEEAESQERTDLFAKWFEPAPDDPIKGVLAAKTIESLRAKSIDEAVEFVTNAGDASWRNWDMYWPVAADYAKRDPKAALDWVLKLPKFPNEPAPPGLAAVVEHWHAQQPDAAKEWLMQNVDQPWWPRAARGIMVSLRTNGNEAGVQQFLSVFTPEAQQMILEDGRKPKPTIQKASGQLEPLK